MKKNVLRWLFGRIRKQIPALVLLTVLSVLQAFSGVAVALVTKRVVDIATRADSAGGTQAFIGAAILLAGLVLVLVLLRFSVSHLRETLRIDLDRAWKKDLLGRLLRGRFSDVKAYHSGELVNRLSTDVKAVNEGVANVIPTFASMIARFTAATAALFVLNWKLTVILLGAGLLVLLLTTSFRRFLKDLHKRVTEANGRANSFIQESVEKLLMIQAMDVADEMDARAGKVFDERAAVEKKRRNFSILGSSGLSLVMNLLYFGSIIFMAAELFAGADGMTFGTLTAVMQLVGQVENPISNLSSVLHAYLAMLGSAERLQELEAIPAEAEAEEIPAAEWSDGLQAKDLSFAYPDDFEPVFEHLDFTVPAGSFTAVTGESGIGKSTVLKILLGIYPPTSGSLTAGERPISRGTRSLFTYVPQGNLLLSGTLRENIVLTRPEATDEEIREALRIAELEEFVQSLPNGLETRIGESGAGISEGQAERIAIARALLREAPVILLDEATSALDPETERRVLDNIRGLKGRTVIAVTHRPYAKEIANNLISLEKPEA